MVFAGFERTDNGAGARRVGVEGEADGRRWGASSDTRATGEGVYR